MNARYKKQSVGKKREIIFWKYERRLAFDLQANIHRERSFNLTRSLIGNEQYANDVSINKLK